MEYRKFGNTLVVRMDPGEEIVEQVLSIAARENITLAQINALGAINDFTVGAYSLEEHKYYSKDFKGTHEVVSLHGNLTVKDGKPYLHLHLGAGNHECGMAGGHLNRAVIAATCEMFITVYEGTVNRKTDPVTGLNIFAFED